MKNATQCAKKLNTLLKKLPPAEPPEFPDQDDPIAVLVLSFLLWESTVSKAGAAYNKVCERIVDFNDLRVSMPHEIAEFLGGRYPMALERAQRLRATLRHTYHREHDASIERLRTMGKREVRKYLRSLDGVSPYVADRVTLLCFETHCIPVDQRLRRALAREGVCDEEMDIADLSTWLTRQVKSSEGRHTHLVLQEWADEHGGVRPPGSTRTKSKTTTRRKTAKA